MKILQNETHRRAVGSVLWIYARWISPVLGGLFCLALVGCVHFPSLTPRNSNPADRPGLLSRIFAPASHPAAPAPVLAPPAAPASPASKETPGAAAAPILPATMQTAVATLAPALQSASAPAALYTATHWLYALSLVCFLAAGLAFWTSHILAAVKFAFAGAAGLVIGKVFSVVIGSFVLACFASFGLGLIVAWQIAERRAGHSGFELGAWIDSRARLAAEEAANAAARLRARSESPQ